MKTKVWAEIQAEFKRSKKERFPVHIVSAAAQVSGKAGNLVAWASMLKYQKNDSSTSEILKDQLKKDAIATIVKAIRFLEKIQ